MTNQPADNPQGPDGTSAETTADTGAASASQADPYAERFAALEQKAEAAARAAEGAARLVHQRDQELYRLRQQAQQRSQPAYEGYGQEETTETRAPAGPDPRDQRIAMIEFRQTHPDWRERLDDMSKVAQDPFFAERFGSDLNDRRTFEAAYEVADNRRLAAENATLKAAQEKWNTAQKSRKDQAFVSGQGATPQHEAVDPAELQKMTRAEMEKKFGRDVLLAGLQ